MVNVTLTCYALFMIMIYSLSNTVPILLGKLITHSFFCACAETFKAAKAKTYSKWHSPSFWEESRVCWSKLFLHQICWNFMWCVLDWSNLSCRKGLSCKSFHLDLALLLWVYKGCNGKPLAIRYYLALHFW